MTFYVRKTLRGLIQHVTINHENFYPVQEVKKSHVLPSMPLSGVIKWPTCTARMGAGRDMAFCFIIYIYISMSPKVIMASSILEDSERKCYLDRIHAVTFHEARDAEATFITSS